MYETQYMDQCRLASRHQKYLHSSILPSLTCICRWYFQPWDTQFLRPDWELRSRACRSLCDEIITGLGGEGGGKGVTKVYRRLIGVGEVRENVGVHVMIMSNWKKKIWIICGSYFVSGYFYFLHDAENLFIYLFIKYTFLASVCFNLVIEITKVGLKGKKRELAYCTLDFIGWTGSQTFLPAHQFTISHNGHDRKTTKIITLKLH